MRNQPRSGLHAKPRGALRTCRSRPGDSRNPCGRIEDHRRIVAPRKMRMLVSIGGAARRETPGATAVRQFHRQEDVAGFRNSHFRAPKTMSSEISIVYTPSIPDYTRMCPKVNRRAVMLATPHEDSHGVCISLPFIDTIRGAVGRRYRRSRRKGIQMVTDRAWLRVVLLVVFSFCSKGARSDPDPGQDSDVAFVGANGPHGVETGGASQARRAILSGVQGLLALRGGFLYNGKIGGLPVGNYCP